MTLREETLCERLVEGVAFTLTLLAIVALKAVGVSFDDDITETQRHPADEARS